MIKAYYFMFPHVIKLIMLVSKGEQALMDPKASLKMKSFTYF